IWRLMLKIEVTIKPLLGIGQRYSQAFRHTVKRRNTMDTQQQTSVGDFLNNGQREQNDGAKTCWWGTRVLQLVVLIIGIVITVWNILSTELAIIASLLSVGS